MKKILLVLLWVAATCPLSGQDYLQSKEEVIAFLKQTDWKFIGGERVYGRENLLYPEKKYYYFSFSDSTISVWEETVRDKKVVSDRTLDSINFDVMMLEPILDYAKLNPMLQPIRYTEEQPEFKLRLYGISSKWLGPSEAGYADGEYIDFVLLPNYDGKINLMYVSNGTEGLSTFNIFERHGR